MPGETEGASTGEAHALTDAFRADLAAMSLSARPVVLVQAAYSRVHRGSVGGPGPETLIDALVDRLGPEGTLLAYAATPENSRTTPAYVRATAGMTEVERERHDAALPAFDRNSSPVSPAVGLLPELVRRRPGARRSRHPQTSFVALGPQAWFLTRRHPNHQHLGPLSPLGRLYELDGYGLLIGVPWTRFTPFHLADYLAPSLPMKTYHAKVAVRGSEEGRWTTFQDLDLHEGHFEELGKRIEDELRLDPPFRIGDAEARLVPVRAAVDAACRLLGSRQVVSRPWEQTPLGMAMLTDHQ